MNASDDEFQQYLNELNDIVETVIFRPFPLFLLSGRDLSIIFFRVPSLVFPLHPLISRFVMSSHPRM